MNVSQSQAESYVTISALVTGGMYAYRYFTEGAGSPSSSNAGEVTGGSERVAASTFAAYKGVYGFGPVLPLGQWIPAAGVTFLAMSITAAVSPEIGASFAALVGVGAFLGNALAVQENLKGEGKKAGTKPLSSLPKAELKRPAGDNHPPVSHPFPTNGSTNVAELPTLVEGGF